jgi:ribosomal protein S18 acetylase RimI-like enzyme
MMPLDPPLARGAGRQIRQATLSDQQKIADLIFFESHVHRHLDWRTPLDWLGYSPYWVFEEGRQITGALACPPDPDSIAWIRLFAYASQLSRYSAWPPLWEAAQRQLSEQGGATVAAIATQRWFEQVLVDNHFDLAEHIVLLRWDAGAGERRFSVTTIKIREMSAQDLPGVTGVDTAAFEPLWRNSLEALTKAYEQSSYASVAEDESGVVGYQISSGGSFGAHLARLAVLPQAQGRGIGAALVGELILHMQRGGGSRVTVNTQDNNAASLALYSRLGFRRTGEEYPVYTLQVKHSAGS